jgi:hypothetical protein
MPRRHAGQARGDEPSPSAIPLNDGCFGLDFPCSLVKDLRREVAATPAITPGVGGRTHGRFPPRDRAQGP